MRKKSTLARIVSAALLIAGVSLVGIFAFNFLGPGPGATTTEPSGFNVPEVQNTQGNGQGASGPRDRTLDVTVPDMARVENAAVPDAAGGDQEALKESAAIHLKGTGFPWQKG